LMSPRLNSARHHSTEATRAIVPAFGFRLSAFAPEISDQ
jgi:hypothetical protein